MNQEPLPLTAEENQVAKYRRLTVDAWYDRDAGRFVLDVVAVPGARGGDVDQMFITQVEPSPDNDAPADGSVYYAEVTFGSPKVGREGPWRVRVEEDGAFEYVVLIFKRSVIALKPVPRI